jgi:Flp pilus assembly protein TadG
MRPIRNLGLGEEGQAFIEAAFTLGIFILILLGVVQLGVVSQSKQRCYAAARHGARLASDDKGGWNSVGTFFAGQDGETTMFRDPDAASAHKSGSTALGVTVTVDYEVPRLPFMPPVVAGTSPLRLGRPMEGIRIQNSSCKMLGDCWNLY